MVIVIDEKLPPPPPYVPQEPLTPITPTTRQNGGYSSTSRLPTRLGTNPKYKKFSDLPPHVILHVVYASFPRTRKTSTAYSLLESPSPAELVHHRQVLYWIEMSLRLVNRSVYIACMHVLRSVYLPSYQSFVRPGYSSDPFPLAAGSTGPGPSPSINEPPPPFEAPGTGPLISVQRETAVLDLFIAAKVREDVWLDETELHLEREETFKDLFDLNQPRARVEDLVRHYGTQSGSIYTQPIPTSYPSSSNPPTPTTPSNQNQNPNTRGSLPFHCLSVSFSPRQVGIIVNQHGRKRTIVSAERSSRDEKLETSAKRLVRELDRMRATGGSRGYGG